MILPEISCYYGKYKCGNYGTNALRVAFDNLILWYSYETIIAYDTPETGRVVSVNAWSTTTGKHLNALEPDKRQRIGRQEFEDGLNAILKQKGLMR